MVEKMEEEKLAKLFNQIKKEKEKNEATLEKATKKLAEASDLLNKIALKIKDEEERRMVLKEITEYRHNGYELSNKLRDYEQ